MTTIRKLISASMLALVGNLLLPLMGVAAVSGTTYDTPDTTMAVPATIAEYTVAADVGQFYAGYGDAIAGTIGGLYTMVRHPILTAQGLAGAIAHPVQTANAVADSVADTWSSGNRGQGQVVGNILIAAATVAAPYVKAGGTAKAASVAKNVATVSDDVVSLFHQGTLRGGEVSSTRAISTSLSRDLTHYNPAGTLNEFQVPRSVYNQWYRDLLIEPRTDLHLSTGIVTPELRIMPPASSQLNQYLVR